MEFTWDADAATVFRAEGCEVLLWNPQPRLLVTRVTGRANAACLRFYTGRAEREMALGRLRVFHDWADMPGYDADARDDLKAWGKAHNHAFDGVVYLVRSKVVAMLISVAALTLGRELRALTERAQFEAELARALDRR